jgi:ribonuclease D
LYNVNFGFCSGEISVSRGISFHEKKRIAERKWGKCLTPPQVRDKDFLVYRREVNVYPFASVTDHPFQKVIEEWRPSPSMLQCLPPPEEFKLIWVDNELLLSDMCRDLTRQDVIAFDTEGHSDFSFLGMCCLIQIATYEAIYLVDCLKLYKQISKHLGPVFSSPSTMKLVLDARDVCSLQRDFHIFSVGVVDIQEVYYMINPSIFQISFKDLVLELLQIDVDKLPQLADWRVRPLHTDLIEYASNDAKLVLKCWYKLLPKLDLSLALFDRSEKSTLSLYRCPTLSPISKTFNEVLKTLSPLCRSIFDTAEQMSLFEKLCNWRISSCRELDNSVQNFISIYNLGLLTRRAPRNEAELFAVISVSKFWPENFRTSLLQIIESHLSPCLQNSTSEIKEMEWEISNCVELEETSSNDVILAPESIEIEIENDLCPPKHQVNRNNLITIRTGKTLRNRNRKKSWLCKQKRKNEDRISQGLEPIYFYRNRGIKRRLRSKHPPASHPAT